ncbi:hypothetical protein PoB_003434100 [Plakobranchus ocellatus]|uniref:Uncharacterized protein n=1 Tax=Plakobranchus ocellatus TaxID=259542 RepID=A0AAV4AHN5_9GAST|nr:hypothetical protein PoB_003434100 [Plakobranchus ocellatus]
MKLAFNYVLKLKSLPRNPCYDVVFETPLSDSAVFTDGSKLEEKVAAAAYFPEHPDRSKATRLRDGASVFSAELEGIALALTEIRKLSKYHKHVQASGGPHMAHPELPPEK